MSEYRGPTANQLQPPKRIQPDLLYSEDLEDMFGPSACKDGVHLEIINVGSGVVAVDPGKKETKRVIKLKLGDGKRILEKQLGLNQTNKKALISAFGSEYVSEWVGWITLRVVLVDDRKNGGMVPAIRVNNTRPNIRPTFDYAKNVAKRKEEAAKHAKAPPKRTPEPDEAQPAQEPDLTDRIAEQMHRAAAPDPGFTAEPEE